MSWVEWLRKFLNLQNKYCCASGDHSEEKEFYKIWVIVSTVVSKRSGSKKVVAAQGEIKH